MKGYPVGVSRISSRFPSVKQKVITMIKPRVPFSEAAQMIALGRTIEASLTSSDMWTAESAPIKVYTGESSPTIKASPVVLHPPRFVNSVNTSEAELFGANTQSGMRTAKKPSRWNANTIFSTIGSLFARKVLKMMQNAVMAMTSKVPCQFLKM